MCCSIGKEYKVAPYPDDKNPLLLGANKKKVFLCGICEITDKTVTKVWRSDISQRAHRACYSRIAVADSLLVKIIHKSVQDTEYRNRSHIASIEKLRKRLADHTIIGYLEQRGIERLSKVFVESHQHYPLSTTKSSSRNAKAPFMS